MTDDHKEDGLPPASPVLAVAAGDDANQPSLSDRAHALIEQYTHALETNSPRTKAELDELRALLLG